MTPRNVLTVLLFLSSSLVVKAETPASGDDSSRPERRRAKVVPFSLGKFREFAQVAYVPMRVGQPVDVAADRGFVYVANREGGLQIFQRVRGTLRERGRYVTGGTSYSSDGRNIFRKVHGWATTVSVAGKLAFVVTEEQGFAVKGTDLHVFDVSDADRPRRLGLTQVGGASVRRIYHYGRPRRRASRGKGRPDSVLYLLTAGGREASSLHTYDLSDPTQPRLARRTLGNKGDVRGIAFDSALKLAYVAQTGPGLLVMDLTDPCDPKQIGQFVETGGAAKTKKGTKKGPNDVILANGHVCLATCEGLVICATAPDRKTVVPRARLETGSLSELKAYGDTIFARADSQDADKEWTYKLIPIDISRPEAPAARGPLLLPGPYSYTVGRNVVHVTEHRKGIRSYVYANARFRTEGAVVTAGRTGDLAKRDGFVFVASGTNGLCVFNAAETKSPELVAQLGLPGGDANSVSLSGDRAYVSGGPGGVYIVDIAKPAEPTLVGQIQLQESSGPKGADTVHAAETCAIEGTRAYICAPKKGLFVYDVSVPSEPKRLGLYETARPDNRVWPHRAVVRDGIAYVACGRIGIRIVDFAKPSTPRLLGQLFDYDCGRMSANDVALRDRLLYVADRDAGLYIINVERPESPSILSRFNLCNAHSVRLDGHLAYVADGGGGIRVLDVSDPRRPVHRGAYNAPAAHVRSLAIDGSTVFASERGGLLVLSAKSVARTAMTAYQVAGGPFLKPGRGAIRPEEIADLYGRSDGFAITQNGVDICSPGHWFSDSMGLRLKPVGRDLSDEAGWPDIPVAPDTVAIDPVNARLKFSDGKRTSARFLDMELLPMGIPHKIRVRGNRIYMTDEEGWNVVIWEIPTDDPVRPIRLGNACTGGFAVSGLSATDDVVVATNNIGWVTMFDAHKPAKPPVLDAVNINARGILCQANRYVYVRKSKTDTVFEITAGKKLKQIAKYEGMCLAEGALQEGRARILVPGDGKIRVWDATDPAKVKLLCDLPFSGRHLAVVGDTLYSLHGNAVSIHDIRDARSPKLLGRSKSLPRKCEALAADGKRVFLAADGPELFRGNGFIYVLDASDPAKPRLAGEARRPPGTGHFAGRVRSIAAKDGVCYVADKGWGLVVVDARDLGNIHTVEGDKVHTVANGGDFGGLFVHNGFAFSGNNWSGIKIVDARNPSDLRYKTNTKDIFGGASLGPIADEKYLYYTSANGPPRHRNHLVITDYLSDPNDHKMVAHIETGPGSWTAGNNFVCKDGKYVYTGDPPTIVDVSKPSVPKIVSRLEGLRAFYTTKWRNNWFIWDGFTIRLVDVTDPKAPKILSEYPGIRGITYWYGRSMYAHRGRLYVTSRQALYIFDVSKRTLRLVSYLPLANFTCDVHASGNYLYVTGYYCGFYIIDVTNPKAPTILEHFSEGPYWDLAGWDNLVCFQSLQVERGILYANEYYSGLITVDVPTPPQEFGDGLAVVLRPTPDRQQQDK